MQDLRTEFHRTCVVLLAAGIERIARLLTLAPSVTNTTILSIANAHI